MFYCNPYFGVNFPPGYTKTAIRNCEGILCAQILDLTPLTVMGFQNKTNHRLF